VRDHPCPRDLLGKEKARLGSRPYPKILHERTEYDGRPYGFCRRLLSPREVLQFFLHLDLQHRPEHVCAAFFFWFYNLASGTFKASFASLYISQELFPSSRSLLFKHGMLTAVVRPIHPRTRRNVAFQNSMSRCCSADRLGFDGHGPTRVTIRICRGISSPLSPPVLLLLTSLPSYATVAFLSRVGSLFGSNEFGSTNIHVLCCASRDSLLHVAVRESLL